MNDNPQDQKHSSSSRNIRLVILLSLLAIVAAGYCYDQYYLIPQSESKIKVVTEELRLVISPENKQQVRDTVGFAPSEVDEYKGYEIERYRFPRGLPFFPGQVLDVAFKDGHIFHITREPMTEADIDSKMPTVNLSDGPRSKVRMESAR